MNKKLCLLILALFGAKTQALSHDHWECTHGKFEQEPPTLLDVEEEWNPEGNDHSGRTLASYGQLRTYGYYGRLSGSSSFKSYVQNDLIPPILDYFSAALKVKYPVSGKMKTSASSICGGSTPSVLKTGVDADFVYFVEIGSSSNYVASSAACSLASGTKRPLMGKTTLSTAYMKATSDPILHEKQMVCIMHEVLHTIGFVGTLFENFLDANGRKRSGHITSATLDGYTARVLNVEPLTSRLRNFFGCSSLKGAYMENTGSSGTAGIHFERRQFPFEFMSSGLISQMQISEFTLALLEGSGWYVPDYNYADPYFFGKGQGCGFLTGKCSSSSFGEFCSSSSRGCSNPGRGGATCRDDSRSDGCKFFHPDDNYDCENANADSYARLPSLQAFGRGKDSKCFTGTLTSSSKAGSQTSFCFQYSCNSSGNELTVKVGSKSILCTSKGSKTVSGYAGVINCPDPREWCSTVGQKKCPRGCMGRGSCVSGKCVCRNGYKGTDCALRA